MFINSTIEVWQLGYWKPREKKQIIREDGKNIDYDEGFQRVEHHSHQVDLSKGSEARIHVLQEFYMNARSLDSLADLNFSSGAHEVGPPMIYIE